ncbi:hypothetical protein AB0758_45090 [Tolypothrix bouteillei VB521301_2]|uniref:hypothetical protein n=1 Tax=Tolypothrix bouteillei TaxID=1246981 RepID=UPI0038B5BC93
MPTMITVGRCYRNDLNADRRLLVVLKPEGMAVAPTVLFLGDRVMTKLAKRKVMSTGSRW